MQNMSWIELSRIRITDTSNSVSNRSYDHQVCFLNYSTI